MCEAVTILMPFKNTAPYLAESVHSILAQTYPHWQLILVDDGSTDNSYVLASSFAQDPRVILIKNEKNLGIAASCNKAMSYATGDYIARCDADDIAHPERLARQVAFLQKHPEIGLVGSFFTQFAEGWESLVQRQVAPADVAVDFLFHLAVVNSTMMARRTVLPQPLYDESAGFEDYDLFASLIGSTPMANLPWPLMRVRKNPASFTQTLPQGQANQNSLAIKAKLLRRMGLQLTSADIALHDRVCRWYHRCRLELNLLDLLHDAPRHHEVDAWFTRITTANLHTHVMDQATLVRKMEETLPWFPE
jgi:glycosyltransferase involved in cell wall biosynthesis